MANSLLTPSSMPYELPPFAEITVDHYRKALDRGMAEHLAEVRAIVDNREPPTFENTLVALERSGSLLDRAARTFFGVFGALSTPDMEAVDEEFAPRLAAHEDAILLDPALFARLQAVHEARDGLDPDDRYLVERYVEEFTVAGAALDDAAKDRLKETNTELATLQSRFDQLLKASAAELAVVVDDPAELDGLTGGEISAAEEAAESRGLPGKHVLTLVAPTNHPYLASLTNRDLRKRLHRAQSDRGRVGEHDTRDTVRQIVRLRAERAELLGYPNHAAATLADSTTRTPERAHQLLDRLAPAAAAKARTEQRALDEVAGFPVEAHDWSYFTEQVRAAAYDVDLAALRPFFEAERVLRDGVFYAAGRLYGLSFTERPDLQGYHPDVRVFEVADADKQPFGLYLLDLYARDTKKGGAWMDSLVRQSELLDQPYAVVCNNLNVPKPAPGEPTLLTYDHVRTFFHEFGHALHGLLARVRYPHFAGTAVFRDFVEYPSQVNEMWLLWPEVLANYAVHHETGERIPADVVERLNAAAAFNEGFGTSEYLGAALLDLAWHALSLEEVSEAVVDVEAFEAAALKRVGLDNPAVPPRYSTPYFAHSFAWGYDSQYYSYIWSEVLDADTGAWIVDHGGLSRAVGDRYRKYILAIGGSTDPLASYREFTGHDPDVAHLIARRGLA